LPRSFLFAVPALFLQLAQHRDDGIDARAAVTGIERADGNGCAANELLKRSSARLRRRMVRRITPEA